MTSVASPSTGYYVYDMKLPVTLLLALLSPAAFGQLQILTTSLPTGGVNSPYNAPLSCNGSSMASWSVFSGTLPPGLTLASSGCAATIGGTPTLSGSFFFTLQVIDPAFPDPASRAFTITIVGSLTVTSPVILPAGVANQNFSYQLSALGGTPPYTWALSPSLVSPNVLPAGLSMTSNGFISGTPTSPNTYGFNIMVTDTANTSVSTDFELKITPPMTITTPSPLPTGTINSTYSQQLNVTGGTAPYTFAIATPATAPPGMTITSSGILSNVPKSAGTFTFTVQATDTNGFQASKVFQLSIAPQGALLTTSVRSLTFSASVGGDTPPIQSVAVTAPSGVPVNYTANVDSGTAPPWLTVTPVTGPTPAAIIVSANQNALQTGKYTATIHVTVPNNSSQTPTDIAVTFNVTNGTTQLAALPASLRFAARSGNPLAFDQMILLANAGGGGAVSFATSIAGRSAWITGLTPAAGRIGPDAPGAIRIFVNSQGLKPGFYHDTIHVTATGASADIPVTMFVSDQGPVIGLSTSGLRFQAREGGGSTTKQTVSILNLGDPSTTLTWQAKLISGSEWLTVANSSGTATQANPGTLTLMANSGAANLSAGGHYALISLTDPNATNSPLYLTAVLDTAPASSVAAPDPSPQGLYFTSGTPAQNVTIYTSSTDAAQFQATAYTSDGNPWLAATPANGNASTATPGHVSVSVTPGSLPPGVYTGYLQISMNGVLRTVTVTLIVTTTASGAPAACSPTRLVVTQTGLASNFSVPAGWPAPLAVQITDNCGIAISNAAVVATFSNGDPPLTLRGDSYSNVYSATWQPGIAQQETTITIRATTATLPAATAQYGGAVIANASTAPTLVPNGALHIFFDNATAAALGAGLAPGNVAQVYGTALAPSMSQTTVPLPPAFKGTSMLVGGEQAPLFYVSDSLLDVQVPVDLVPNRQYSVVANSNGALTLPSSIDVTPVQPGIAQSADGMVIAQISGTTTLISAANPAKPGQNLTIYLAGMGATDPVVASGQPTPGQLVPVTNQPVVTLDGQQVSYGYAGLTPTGIGLYQINLTVPQNARAGVLDLVVSQNGVASNTVKLPVSN